VEPLSQRWPWSFAVLSSHGVSSVELRPVAWHLLVSFSCFSEFSYCAGILEKFECLIFSNVAPEKIAILFPETALTFFELLSNQNNVLI
jgi:hypothetical protein